jgi:hypothetical protein
VQVWPQTHCGLTGLALELVWKTCRFSSTAKPATVGLATGIGADDAKVPGAMAVVFGLRKSHAIKRGGQTVRGFKSVTIRDDAQ